MILVSKLLPRSLFGLSLNFNVNLAKGLSLGFALWVGLFFMGGAHNALANELSAEEAHAFIESVSNQAKPILEQDQSQIEERKREFSDLVYRTFAFENLAAFALGQDWRSLDDAAKKEYVETFTTYVILVNASRIGQFGNVAIKLGNASPAGKSDIVVKSQWIEVNQQPIDVDWRVRKINGEAKILDVIISGISMAQTQRDEFQSIMSRSDIDGLNKLMHDKIQELK